MKRKIGIVVIILVIGIVGFFGIKRYQQRKIDYTIEQVEAYNYYIYRENEQYGVINKEGQVVIEAKYSNVIIPNPDRDRFVCYQAEEVQIFNAQNEELFTEYEVVEPIKLKNVASVLAYEKSVLMYQQDGLYGLIDFDGNVITKNIYDSIENLQPTEGKFVVAKDGKYGVIDLKGNQLVDIAYDKISSDGYYTEQDGYKKSGFIVSNTTEDGFRYGYIDYTGKDILEVAYNDIERITKEEEKNIYLIVSENGQYGLYNQAKKIIENEYQSITYEEDTDVLILQKNKKYGVANLAGDFIIPVENDAITSKGIYLYVESGNDRKVYDTQGNTVDMNYNRSIYQTENAAYKISTILNNDITYYGILDQNDNPLVEEKYRYIEYVYDQYFIATNEDGNLGIINSNGKVILDMKYNSLQKIKGKNMIQAVEAETGVTEFYSAKMEKTASVEGATIQIQDDYIIIANDQEKIYLDNDGNKIEDITSLKNTSFPDQIGDYQKEQITIENVYYTKK